MDGSDANSCIAMHEKRPYPLYRAWIMRALNDSLSSKASVAKKATDVSHFETEYFGPKRLLILDPVATDTIWLSGGKKSLSACSAI